MQNLTNLWYTFYVQIFWNYHTMLGVGSCYLLDKLYGDDELPESIRYRIVLFFNGQPYLVPYAISAIEKELHLGSDEKKISRFIQGVVGILGAVGDHYFWNGLKPLLILLTCLFAFIGLNSFFMISLSLCFFLIYNYFCKVLYLIVLKCS